MATNVQGKVVLITGSGSGIGRATAWEFCRQGWRVMLNGRNADKLKRSCDALQAAGFEAAFCVADATDEAASQRLIETTIATFGRLDALVNNAGVAIRTRFDETSTHVLRPAIDSQIYGSLWPTMAALPFVKATQGSIVFISSLIGLYGLPGNGPYSLGKMALTSLAQCLRVELQESRVHVGLMRVGFTVNDPDKRVLSSSGTYIPVGKRARSMEQSQEQVALAIYRMVERRQANKTLTVLGKCFKMLTQISPTLVDWIIGFAYKKNKNWFR